LADHTDLMQLRQDGQWFAVQEQSQQALAETPDDLTLVHLRGLALVNVGAIDEAIRFITEFKLRERLESAEQNRTATTALLGDLWGLLGRVYKERWVATGENAALEVSFDSYHSGYQATGELYPLINAAAMARILGRPHEALSRKAIEFGTAQIQKNGENYWDLATLGEANLILNNPDNALKSLVKAGALGSLNERVSTARQLALLEKNGLIVPDSIHNLLQLPEVIVFTGHMIDRADIKVPRFPAVIEEPVRAQIGVALDRAGPTVAYASAACGADILFLEEHQKRGRETNIVLPFTQRDFVDVSVRYAGEDWVRRFEAVIANADSVYTVTDEPYLDEESLFSFCNDVMLGRGVIRAEQLMADVRVLSVIDAEAQKRRKGGSRDFIASLPTNCQVEIVDLGKIRSEAPSETPKKGTTAKPKTAPAPSPRTMKRQMAFMMFSDLKDFSKLGDDQSEPFMGFMQIVADEIAAVKRPDFVRTVGDAIFAVTDSAIGILDFAIAVKRACALANERIEDLAFPLKVRIALHAAPAFAVYEPISQRDDWFGSNVNRTARLEPITVPNHIYATDQFVALLSKENCADDKPAPFADWKAELVGELELSKKYGKQRVYHIADL